MQLEELLAALQQGQGQQTNDRFQVIPHESGNTVIADNRFGIDRPHFFSSPEGKALLASGEKLSMESAQRGQEGFNQNYISSLIQPYRQGPLPNYEILKDDPKWWELYSTNPGIADKVYGATHGKSFTQAIKDQEEIATQSKKTLQGMIGEGKLYQDAQGNLKQLVQRPDAVGDMKWKEIDAPFEVASMLNNAGGLEGLGQVNIKNALAAREAANAKPSPSSAGPSLQAGAEPQPGQGRIMPRMFGLGQVGQNILRDARVEGLEGLAVENPDTVPARATNLFRQFTGGQEVFPPDPREIPRQDSQRLMINILRARKGLPPMSDQMWQLFQQGQGGRRMLQ